MTLDELREIVETPGRLMGLYAEYGKTPTRETLGLGCQECCALGLMIIAGMDMDGFEFDHEAFADGFDGIDEDDCKMCEEFRLGRRAAEICGLSEPKGDA